MQRLEGLRPTDGQVSQDNLVSGVSEKVEVESIREIGIRASERAAQKRAELGYDSDFPVNAYSGWDDPATI